MTATGDGPAVLRALRERLARGDDDASAAAGALAVLRMHEHRGVESLVEELLGLRAEHGGPVLDRALVAAVGAYVDELTAVLQQAATRDPLTALPNRAAFDEALAHEVAAASRSHAPALLLVDLDGFKAVNDTDGHLAGDAVLVAVARLLEANVRRGDLPARLGGDEFAVILPRTGRRAASTVATRLLRASRTAPGLASEHARVTLSVGVGWLRQPADAAALIAVADSAMYAVKAAGGDGSQLRRAA